MVKRKKGYQGNNNEGEEVFQVELILAARRVDKSSWEYLIKWAGYTEADNTWEPKENISSCGRLLKSFWEHIGVDIKRSQHPIGRTFKASSEWIERERRFFRKEIADDSRDVATDPGRASRLASQEGGSSFKLKISPKLAKRPPIVGETIEISDSSDSDVPLRRRRKRRLQMSDEEDLPSTVPNPISTGQGRKPDNGKGKQRARTPSASPPASPSSLFSITPSPSPMKQPQDLPRVPTAPTLGSTSTVRPSDIHRTSKTQVQGSKAVGRRNSLVAGPQTNMTAGSTLSTKSRLAQASLALIDPKTGKPVPPSRPPSKVNPPPRPSVLSSLSFKKTNAAQPSIVEGPESAAPTSPKAPTLESSLFLPVPDSPLPGLYDINDAMRLDDYDYPVPASPPPSSSIPEHSNPVLQAAEDFLVSIMPPALAAPLETAPKSPGSSPIPLRPIAPKTPLKRIPKKWKWTGELFIDVAPDTAERLCDIVLSDPTDHLGDGLRLNVLFETMDSLRLRKMVPSTSLEVILNACTPVHQMARCTPEGQDGDKLRSLSTLMTATRQVTYANMHLDSTNVGVLFVLPAALEVSCSRLQVPAELKQDGVFIVALFGWSPTLAAHRQYEWRLPLKKIQQKIEPSPRLSEDLTEHKLIRSNSRYQHALQILKFPTWLLETMSLPNRRYCVWWEGDGTRSEKGLETTLLACILDQCGAKDVGYKADVRAVFVHVGAMSSLYKLVALAERRSKRPEVQFISYGTHESARPERWGIREIYPLGGVLTFTPNALYEDPVGAHNLIMQVAEHNLWTCYLLPTVVGMVAKLTCRDRDPLDLFDRGDFVDDYLLNLIIEGQISLLRAPSCSLERGHSERWTLSQLMLLSLKQRALLQECMREFTLRYANVAEADWATTIETEISQDLMAMQLQPAMMDVYRRYVVIKGKKDENVPWDKHGLEWYSLGGFSFKDDFFLKLTEDNKAATTPA